MESVDKNDTERVREVTNTDQFRHALVVGPADRYRTKCLLLEEKVPRRGGCGVAAERRKGSTNSPKTDVETQHLAADTTPVKNQRFLPPSPQGEGFGRCPNTWDTVGWRM